MNKDIKIYTGVALAVIGGIVMFKNLDEKKSTPEENKATNGLSGIPLSVVGAGIFAVGGYLIFKKD